MKKFLAAVAVAAAASSLGGFAQASVGLQERAYIVPAGDITSGLCHSPAGLPGIGGDCFDVEGGSDVTVKVEDMVNTTAAGFAVRFYGSSGRIPGEPLKGCNTGDFSVPTEATLMRVFVGVMNGDCPSNGVSVAGTIFVSPYVSPPGS